MVEAQIIERDGKPEYAVIPIAEWRRIQAMVEEFEDIRDFDAALARRNRRMIPFEVTSAILDGASPIRAWRERRASAKANSPRLPGSTWASCRKPRTAHQSRDPRHCANWPRCCV